ncbi:MAG: pyruvate, water dikinase regulatory protein [Pseudomonadota bacterium]
MHPTKTMYRWRLPVDGSTGSAPSDEDCTACAKISPAFTMRSRFLRPIFPAIIHGKPEKRSFGSGRAMSGQVTLHLVSDSTGETVLSAVKAASGQFPALNLDLHIHAFVRNHDGLAPVVSAIDRRPGPVFFTLADPALGSALCREAEILGQPVIDVLAPTLKALSGIAGGAPAVRPGGQYRVDRDYLDRVAAIDYAIAHDDGLSAERLKQADVILVGVSRTSKTPTCIYLAYQGVRAANVPLLRGEDLPPSVSDAQRAGVAVIGLTASPQRLAQIRAHRVDRLDLPEATDYADLDIIRDEVTDARLLFERHDLPVIDVTRRSIEETAAAIQQFLRQRALPT